MREVASELLSLFRMLTCVGRATTNKDRRSKAAYARVAVPRHDHGRS
jgi:hypothetical protein